MSKAKRIIVEGLKRLFILAICFFCFLSVASVFTAASRFIPPLGMKLWPISEYGHKADGRFDEEEVNSIEHYVEDKTIVTKNNKASDSLIIYTLDIHIFIREHLLPSWRGVEGLFFNIETKEGMEWAWNSCSTRTTKQEFTDAPAFYCPYNSSATIREIEFTNAIENYDHEEGHHINDLDGDTREFTSEFNRLWKGLIRQAMNFTVGIALTPNYFSYRPVFGPTRAIKDIGIYTSGSLMFFMVMNHFNGDLIRPAKFIFNNDEEVLEGFFYRQLKRYPQKYSIKEIWYKEYIKFINSKKVLENIRELRKRTQVNARN